MTIAIVGAGLGGLALARVLHVNGIDAVVYERNRRAARVVRAACLICTPGPGSGRCARPACSVSSTRLPVAKARTCVFSSRTAPCCCKRIRPTTLRSSDLRSTVPICATYCWTLSPNTRCAGGTCSITPTTACCNSATVAVRR